MLNKIHKWLESQIEILIDFDIRVIGFRFNITNASDNNHLFLRIANIQIMGLETTIFFNSK